MFLALLHWMYTVQLGFFCWLGSLSMRTYGNLLAYTVLSGGKPSRVANLHINVRGNAYTQSHCSCLQQIRFIFSSSSLASIRIRYEYCLCIDDVYVCVCVCVCDRRNSAHIIYLLIWHVEIGLACAEKVCHALEHYCKCKRNGCTHCLLDECWIYW